MTTNIGTRDIKTAGAFGFGQSSSEDKYDSMKNVIEEAMKRLFNPEFMNRIDDVIIFRSLTTDDIKEVIDIHTESLRKRLGTLGVKLELTKPAKEFLAEKGFDPAFGARPLRRAVQRYLEDPLAEEMLKGTFTEGMVVKVKIDKRTGELKFSELKAETETKDPNLSDVSTN